MAWVDDLKYQYNKGDSAVRRLLFWNIGIFIFVWIVRLFAGLYKIEPSQIDEALRYFYIPANFTDLLYQPWSLVTYMFLHDGLWHILGNMLLLFYIGNIIEGFIGKAKTYQLYFLSGTLGGIIHIVFHTIFPLLADQSHIPTLGASGAVFGIMVGTITLLPEYQIRLMLIGIIKLRWLVLIYVALNVLSLASPDGVSHTAHLGGALVGFLYIRYIQGRLGFTLPKIKNPFKRSKLKVERNPTSVNNYQKYTADQEAVDAILDKISRSGYGSLTQDEKDVLFKASQKED